MNANTIVDTFLNRNAVVYRTKILLHDLNIQLSRVAVLAESTVQYEPPGYVPPGSEHKGSIQWAAAIVIDMLVVMGGSPFDILSSSVFI